MLHLKIKKAFESNDLGGNAGCVKGAWNRWKFNEWWELIFTKKQRHM